MRLWLRQSRLLMHREAQFVLGEGSWQKPVVTHQWPLMVTLIAIEAPSIHGHGKAAVQRREADILAMTCTVSDPG